MNYKACIPDFHAKIEDVQAIVAWVYLRISFRPIRNNCKCDDPNKGSNKIYNRPMNVIAVEGQYKPAPFLYPYDFVHGTK